MVLAPLAGKTVNSWNWKPEYGRCDFDGNGGIDDEDFKIFKMLMEMNA